MAQPLCLIADDDEGIRSLLVAILEHAGLRCLLAHDVASAQALLAAEPVDVMLLDLSLLDGAETAFIREVRTAQPGLPVVVVSGRRDPAVTRDVLAAGASAYVTKPFQAAQLRDTVLGTLAPPDGETAGDGG